MLESAPPSPAIIRALLERGAAADNPAVQIVEAMLLEAGYDVSRAGQEAKANDQRIRLRTAHLLGETEHHLVRFEASFRAIHVPPSTREHPFPPAEVLKTVRSIDGTRRRVSDLGSAIHTHGTPGTSQIWRRLQSDVSLLEQLLTADVSLVAGAKDLLEVVQTLRPSEPQPALESLEPALSLIDRVIRDRSSLLAVP